jgi:hypothetical protein
MGGGVGGVGAPRGRSCRRVAIFFVNVLIVGQGVILGGEGGHPVERAARLRQEQDTVVGCKCHLCPLHPHSIAPLPI